MRQLSWVESANRAETQFPLENLPYGVFTDMESNNDPHCGVAIGDFVLDLQQLERDNLIDVGVSQRLFDSDSINLLMASGSDIWHRVRARLIELLAHEGEHRKLVESALKEQRKINMLMPFKVAEFTDFYSGQHHAQNVGTMLRGADNALPPNWLHMPIGYNGRASTVVVSGTNIVRPNGQRKPKDANVPTFGPSQRLDIELELGAVVGTGNAMGRSVSVREADDMIFGYVLLNDWSARDIQAWEYQPLGPFQAKAFATSISPWVVTKAALEPFRCSTPERTYPLLDYLCEPRPMLYDIDLEIQLRSHDSEDYTTVSRTNFREMYYSSAQQLCHHTSGGCSMKTGDLLGSGTISGPDADARGSLLELSWGGKEPVELVNGEQRSFLEDGDSVRLTGCARADQFTVGFGECTGMVVPSTPGSVVR